MTEKEMKSLRRADLLEMLISSGKNLEEAENEFQAKEAALKAHIKELEKKLQQLEEKLSEREIAIEQAGSIAEASVQINGVFEAAQKAADQYLENIKHQNATIEERCLARETESQMKADHMILESKLRCEDMEKQAHMDAELILQNAQNKKIEIESQCARMVSEAKIKSQEHWDQVSGKLQEVIDSHEYLQKMFADLKI